MPSSGPGRGREAEFCIKGIVNTGSLGQENNDKISLPEWQHCLWWLDRSGSDFKHYRSGKRTTKDQSGWGGIAFLPIISCQEQSRVRYRWPNSCGRGASYRTFSFAPFADSGTYDRLWWHSWVEVHWKVGIFRMPSSLSLSWCLPYSPLGTRSKLYSDF